MVVVKGDVRLEQACWPRLARRVRVWLASRFSCTVSERVTSRNSARSYLRLPIPAAGTLTCRRVVCTRIRRQQFDAQRLDWWAFKRPDLNCLAAYVPLHARLVCIQGKTTHRTLNMGNVPMEPQSDYKRNESRVHGKARISRLNMGAGREKKVGVAKGNVR